MFITGYTIKTLFMLLYVSHSNRKTLNLPKDKKSKILIFLDIIIAIGYVCMCEILKTKINTTIFIEIATTLIYVILYKMKVTYALLITAVSLAINQVIFYIVSIITYFPVKILNIEDEYLYFAFMMIIQGILLTLFWRIKRIHNGITFLKKWKDDEYINLMLLKRLLWI